MRRAGIMLGIILIGLGIFGVARSDFPRENPSRVRIVRPRDGFTDQEFNALRSLVSQLNRSDDFIYEGIRGTNLKMDTVRTEVWSRTGDTLIQSGDFAIAANIARDTIGISVAYSDLKYEVFLQWRYGNTAPPGPDDIDTLWNITFAGGPNQYKVDSFIVQVAKSGTAKEIGWMTIGN